MRRADVLERLRVIEPKARLLGVGALYLFGSHARDEASTRSDVDVLIEPESADFFRFKNFMSVYNLLQDAVPGHPIGYATRGGLREYARADTEREAIRIF